MSTGARWIPRVVAGLLVLTIVATGSAMAANLLDVRSEQVVATEAPRMQLFPPEPEEAVAPGEVETPEPEFVDPVLERARKRLEREEAREAKRLQERREKRRAARREERRLAKLRSTPYTFTIGSFNVLGSQHTRSGGQKSSYPSAVVRTPRAAALARAHGVDILGTQELQEDQLPVLTAQTGMRAWPGFEWGTAETDNSILYDPEVFEFVSGDVFHITFMGRTRPQPILRLRHRATTRELYVVNAHPSAGEGQYAAERDRGHATIAAVVNQLDASGLPVLVTGDMNDRERFYCNVVARTPLTASNGGGAGCAPPPPPIPVDWVVGSRVAWSGYHRDTTPVEQKTSDHFFISATATVQ